MRYRTLFLFLLMFASAVGAALSGDDNLFPALLFIAFPFFSALMFTSIVYDIMYPQPAAEHAPPAPQPQALPQSAPAPPAPVRPHAHAA